ncbi:hypothetical protein SNE40_009004 [Patella caerulea]|uniref:Uncharacterized protein n=1 Tax=Patella caerulea TaxID=87958 RepID=A0AAN8JU47_PATCE
METYLLILDSFLSILLFGPLVAAYWRGTWGIADLYLFPEDKLLSQCLSLGGGMLISFTMMLLQDRFNEWNRKMSSTAFLVISRIHSYILGHACVHYWRGIWGFLEYTGRSLHSASITAALSTILLVLFRGMCDSVAAPLYTMTDLDRKDYFVIPTRFKIKSNFSLKFTVDCCFTVICVLGTVAVQWRSIWVLADLLLAPHDPIYSSWLSMAAGNIFTVLLLVAQWPLMKIAKTLKRKESKFYILVLIEDLMSLCGNIAAVLVWRGFWNLQDQFLLIDNQKIVWALHAGSVTILIILLHFKTVTLAGAWTDGDVIFSGEKIFFETKFITSIIKHRDQQSFQSDLPATTPDENWNTDKTGVAAISYNSRRENNSNISDDTRF